MRATTVLAIGFGIAVGFATSRGMQVDSKDANRFKAAVQEFNGAQAAAFAVFGEAMVTAAKKLDDELSVLLKPYVDAGEYIKADVIRRTYEPYSNRSLLKSIAAKKLTWCCVPGIYKMEEPGQQDRQIVLGYDGRFQIRPYEESGWSGQWQVTDGVLVLRSDRGWERRVQLVPQFSNKDLSLRWQEDIRGE